MNRILKQLCIFFTAILLSTPAFAEENYPPEGWLVDIREAITQAEQEEKMILLNFAGSDWCFWCMKLDEEVFLTREFKEWSEDNLVKVFLDFPRQITLAEDIKRQNQVLQQYFRVKGFPTIIILDSNLNPLLQTGYQDGGPQEYIRHITEDRNISIESPEEFQTHFKEIIEKYIGAFEEG